VSHDHRERRWRHLDIGAYATELVAAVPRVRCLQHRVRVIDVPWARSRIGFTTAFEARAVSFMAESSVRAVSKFLDLTWEEANGMLRRAIDRGDVDPSGRRDLDRRRRTPSTSTGGTERHGDMADRGADARAGAARGDPASMVQETAVPST
jgi:transposase